MDKDINIFSLPEELPDKELTDLLCQNKSFRIERIVSSGQTSPEGFWYDQDEDEWVVVLQGSAKLRFYNGRAVSLNKGDHFYIPAHLKHRVEYTSKTPKCIWLCVFG